MIDLTQVLFTCVLNEYCYKQLNYFVVNKVVHKQTEAGDRLTAELSGQRTEGRPTMSLHASEIEDNDLRQCACQVKDEQLSLHASMKLMNRSHTMRLSAQGQTILTLRD